MDSKDPKFITPQEELENSLRDLQTKITSEEEISEEERQSLLEQKDEAILLYRISQWGLSAESPENEDEESKLHQIFFNELDTYLTAGDYSTAVWIATCKDEELAKALKTRLAEHFIHESLENLRYEEMGRILYENRDIYRFLGHEGENYIYSRVYPELKAKLTNSIALSENGDGISSEESLENVRNILNLSRNVRLISDEQYNQVMQDVQELYIANIINATDLSTAITQLESVHCLTQKCLLTEGVEKQVKKALLGKVYSEINSLSTSLDFEQIREILNNDRLKALFPNEYTENLVYKAYTYHLENAQSLYNVWGMLSNNIFEAKRRVLLTKNQYEEIWGKCLEVLPQKLIDLLTGDEKNKIWQVKKFISANLYKPRSIIDKDNERGPLLRSLYTLLTEKISGLTSVEFFPEVGSLNKEFFLGTTYFYELNKLIDFYSNVEKIKGLVNGVNPNEEKPNEENPNNVNPRDFINSSEIKSYLEDENALAYLDVITREVEKILSSGKLKPLRQKQWTEVLFSYIYTKRIALLNRLGLMKMDEGNRAGALCEIDRSTRIPLDLQEDIILEVGSAIEKRRSK